MPRSVLDQPRFRNACASTSSPHVSISSRAPRPERILKIRNGEAAHQQRNNHHRRVLQAGHLQQAELSTLSERQQRLTPRACLRARSNGHLLNAVG